MRHAVLSAVIFNYYVRHCNITFDYNVPYRRKIVAESIYSLYSKYCYDSYNCVNLLRLVYLSIFRLGAFGNQKSTHTNQSEA